MGKVGRLEICADLDSCLQESMYSNDLIVAVSRQRVKSSAIHKQVYCFEQFENVFGYLVSIMIRSDHKFRAAIDENLQRLIEAGLVSKWQKDFTAAKYKKDDHSHGLQLKHLSATLLLAGIFWMTAFIVFISEQIIYRAANSRNAHRFWKIASKIIDGDRHTLLLLQK